MKIILFMLIIKKVIKIIKKRVKNHQNTENQKFIKQAFKIRNTLNKFCIKIIQKQQKLIINFYIIFVKFTSINYNF